MRIFIFLIVTLVSISTTAQKPFITTFSPDWGPIGTTVSIMGDNFNGNEDSNIVYFGPVKGIVLDATQYELLVRVPAGAGFQPITVTTGGYTLAASRPFRVTASAGGMDFSSGSFGPAVSISGGSNIAVADFDGDGKIDLAHAGFYQSSIAVYRNTTVNQVFSVQSAWSSSIQNPRDIRIADMNGDGLPDLVVSANLNRIIAVYKNTSTAGSISFSYSPVLCTTTEGAPNDLAVVDIDKDGKPDIATVVEDADKISVFRNASGESIAFDAEKSFGTDDAPWRINAGDLNRDGYPELITTQYSLFRGARIFENKSSPGSISFTSSFYSVPQRVYDAAIGDFDGDNKMDVLLTDRVSNTLTVLRNTTESGAITFASPVVKDVSSTPADLVLGDLNGDGKPEPAMASYFSSSQVCIVKNNSSSGIIDFGTQYQTYSTGTGTFDVVLADMNGDGRTDILTGNSQGTPVSISYLQNNLNFTANEPPVVETYTTAANGKWSEPATWVGGSVPPAGVNIIIKHIVSANFSRICNSITIEPGGNCTVEPAVKLTLLQ
ncbi:MAG: FG-GAP-like repeat-containing protein [Ferruginibacter sp.]